MNIYTVNVSDEGKITIPDEILEKLHVKPEAELIIYEKNGRICLDTISALSLIQKEAEGKTVAKAVQEAQLAFAGEAKKAGFRNEEEMAEYLLEIRKEIRGY